MGSLALSPSRALGFALGFSLLFFVAYYVSCAAVGIDLADEGYLWYGAQATGAGEVPLRDFQSYDPGRYYWCAAFASFLGDGLLGLRAAAMAFGAVGLTCALLVASRFARSRAELALCGALLGLWMFPIYKLFEPALACMATWFAVRLIEEPSPRRHLCAGLFVGLAAFFGRNHALYAGLAFGAIALLLIWKERPERGGGRLALLALGAVLGALPMWLMLLLVPGFAAGFVSSSLIFLQHGSQPLPHPWRWPWSVAWSQVAGADLALVAALTLVFLLPCIVLPIGVLRGLWLPAGELRRRAPAAGAAFVGALYIHHASVRSHPLHLAQCLPPVLLLALAMVAALEGRLRRALYGALALVLVLALFEAHPHLARFRPGQKERELVEYVVAGEKLHIIAPLVTYLNGIERAVKQHVPADETVFIAPNRPGLYSVLGKLSPSWWIYFFWDASPEEQQELIARLEQRKVDWVLIPQPHRKRADRYFHTTHPEVVEYFQREFERIELGESLGRDDWLLHRRIPLR